MPAKLAKQSYNLLAIFTLILLGAIIYFNTFHSSFHFDDNIWIGGISDLKALWRLYPARFITSLSLALNNHLTHRNVFSYHFFNLAIHLSSAILVWWFVLLTFATPVMRDKKIAEHADLIAFFVALIFLTHPIQTEGVTYICQRATSLASLFYLACLSLYVKSRLLQQQGKSLIASRVFYCSSFITAVIAMFTKEITVTIPLMIVLYEFSFLKHKSRLNWKQLIPFLLTLSVIPLIMFFSDFATFREMRRVAESIPNISSWHYLLTQFRVMVTYVRLELLPLNQNLDYDYPIVKTILSLPILISLLFLITLIIIAFKLFRKYRLVSFGIFFFFLALIPESSILPLRDVIFEHRLYLPTVGFSLLLVSLIYYLFETKTIKPMVIMLLVIISCYSVLTYRRNSVWKDELTLWDDTVKKSPNKARPYRARGYAYQTKGNYDAAISDYNKAIEINPGYAEDYFNRSLLYLDKGEYRKASEDLTKAESLGYHAFSDLSANLKMLAIINPKPPDMLNKTPDREK
jgi:protein O-mannosyl-transferase